MTGMCIRPFFLASLVYVATGSAQAQPTPETSPATEPPPAASPSEPAADSGLRWQWSTSAGVNHYREPSQDMRLRGPELGVHLRLSGFAERWQAEGDVLAGVQRYDSPSGRLNQAENLETRWRLLYQAWPQSEAQGLYLGPALHTFYNDLRGRTDLGAGGYQRESVGLWLAAQWRQSLDRAEGSLPMSGLQLDAGRLIRARHTSYLSQANRLYPDLTNTQTRGWYVQAKLDIPTERLVLQPFVRYTRLMDSDRVRQGLVSGYEPASHRWQAGLAVTWPAR